MSSDEGASSSNRNVFVLASAYAPPVISATSLPETTRRCPTESLSLVFGDDGASSSAPSNGATLRASKKVHDCKSTFFAGALPTPVPAVGTANSFTGVHGIAFVRNEKWCTAPYLRHADAFTDHLAMADVVALSFPVGDDAEATTVQTRVGASTVCAHVVERLLLAARSVLRQPSRRRRRLHVLLMAPMPSNDAAQQEGDAAPPFPEVPALKTTSAIGGPAAVGDMLADLANDPALGFVLHRRWLAGDTKAACTASAREAVADVIRIAAATAPFTAAGVAAATVPPLRMAVLTTFERRRVVAAVVLQGQVRTGTHVVASSAPEATHSIVAGVRRFADNLAPEAGFATAGDVVCMSFMPAIAGLRSDVIPFAGRGAVIAGADCPEDFVAAESLLLLRVREQHAVNMLLKAIHSNGARVNVTGGCGGAATAGTVVRCWVDDADEATEMTLLLYPQSATCAAQVVLDTAVEDPHHRRPPEVVLSVLDVKLSGRAGAAACRADVIGRWRPFEAHRRLAAAARDGGGPAVLDFLRRVYAPTTYASSGEDGCHGGLMPPWTPPRLGVVPRHIAKHLSGDLQQKEAMDSAVQLALYRDLLVRHLHQELGFRCVALGRLFLRTSTTAASATVGMPQPPTAPVSLLGLMFAAVAIADVPAAYEAVSEFTLGLQAAVVTEGGDAARASLRGRVAPPAYHIAGRWVAEMDLRPSNLATSFRRVGSGTTSEHTLFERRILAGAAAASPRHLDGVRAFLAKHLAAPGSAVSSVRPTTRLGVASGPGSYTTDAPFLRMLVVDEGVPGPLLRAIVRSGNDGQPSRFPGMVMDGNTQLVRSIYEHIFKDRDALGPSDVLAATPPNVLLPAWGLEALCRCRTGTDTAKRVGGSLKQTMTNVNATSLHLIARAVSPGGGPSATVGDVYAALSHKFPNLDSRNLDLFGVLHRREVESLLIRSRRFRGVSMVALRAIIAYV